MFGTDLKSGSDAGVDPGQLTEAGDRGSTGPSGLVGVAGATERARGRPDRGVDRVGRTFNRETAVESADGADDEGVADWEDRLSRMTWATLGCPRPILGICGHRRHPRLPELPFPGSLVSLDRLYQLQLDDLSTSTFTLRVPQAGCHALFTQHGPDEFAMTFTQAGRAMVPVVTSEYSLPGHEHDESVSSVGIVEERELDPGKVNAWMSELLQTKGADIFRMKGILNIRGEPQPRCLSRRPRAVRGQAGSPVEPRGISPEPTHLHRTQSGS